MLKVSYPYGSGTKADPFRIPNVRPPATVPMIRFEAYSSHGPNDPDLYVITGRSSGCIGIGRFVREDVERGVIQEMPLYVMKPLEGVEKVSFRARKYGGKTKSGRFSSGHSLYVAEYSPNSYDTVFYCAAMTDAETARVLYEPEDEVVLDAVPGVEIVTAEHPVEDPLADNTITIVVDPIADPISDPLAGRVVDSTGIPKIGYLDTGASSLGDQDAQTPRPQFVSGGTTLPDNTSHTATSPFDVVPSIAEPDVVKDDGIEQRMDRIEKMLERLTSAILGQ